MPTRELWGLSVIKLASIDFPLFLKMVITWPELQPQGSCLKHQDGWQSNWMTFQTMGSLMHLGCTRGWPRERQEEKKHGFGPYNACWWRHVTGEPIKAPKKKKGKKREKKNEERKCRNLDQGMPKRATHHSCRLVKSRNKSPRFLRVRDVGNLL